MSLFDLSGKTAIVTGGNGGIGLGMALGLAEAGASVAVVGRNPEKTRAAAAEIEARTKAKALAVVADLARPEEVKRAVAEAAERFGRVDALFNNAGINIRRAPQEFTLEEWKQVMDANLTSAFLASQEVYPWMKRQGGGKIVNTGSMTSVFGSSFAAPYATTKGAIVQLTKSLALAWAADGIRVNAILPGWFDTEMTIAAREQVPGLHEKVLARIAQGRWAKPADMAGAAVFLASPASDYITGVALPVDGGYLATL